jgi:hypothetical protein
MEADEPLNVTSDISYSPLGVTCFFAYPWAFMGVVCSYAERLGSGDGERKTLLTRQIAFEPLPASVLFGLCWLAEIII